MCKFVCILAMMLGLGSMSFAASSESNGTAAEDIDGEFLLGLGRRLHKPMLALIGMAIENLHRKHPCDDWTQWSNCGVQRIGYVSTRKRTRNCRSSLIQTDLEKNYTSIETDEGVCEGKCPRDYNITANRFCVKLYKEEKTFEAATKQWSDDNGRMISIDSELKYVDMKNSLQGFSRNIYIDGRRKDATSPWLLGDGSEMKFFKWQSGYPKNDLCIARSYSTYEWYDTSCTITRPTLCEILM